jgi:hypothetical protein
MNLTDRAGEQKGRTDLAGIFSAQGVEAPWDITTLFAGDAGEILEHMALSGDSREVAIASEIRMTFDLE